MSEYNTNTAASSSKIGTPLLVIRQDKPQTDATTNQYMTRASADSAGNLRINPEGGEQTFSGASTAVVLASSATNVWAISGSASAAIKVTKLEIYITGDASTADVILNKQYAGDTGGTSTAITLVVHDTANIPFGAMPSDIFCKAYTANPTAGSSTGTIRQGRYSVQPVTSVGAAVLRWEFGATGGQPIVLHGTSEWLAVNLNAATVTNGKITVNVEGRIVTNG